MHTSDTVDVHNNHAACIQFEDPNFPVGYIYSAKRLPTAEDPPDTLKPEDFEHLNNNNYGGGRGGLFYYFTFLRFYNYKIFALLKKYFRDFCLLKIENLYKNEKAWVHFHLVIITKHVCH